MTALAKAAGMTPAQFEEMGNAGKLSFDIIDAAMRKLTTGTGHLAGQVARYRGTALGMFEAIRDGIGRIPQAFFSGVIANGMGDAKTGMAAIRDMVDGWVSSAKRFGEVLAAALKVAKQLWDKGEFASTLKDALIAAFGAGVDYLVKGMVGAAYAFGAVLKQVIDWAKAEYIKVMYPQLGTLVPQKEISASSVGATASAGFSEGYASTEGPGFGRAADTRFHERVDKMMFEARGGAAGAITRMMEPFQNIISKAFPRAGLEAFRDLPNNATAIHGGGGTTFAAPDALAKIGLFVGAGGPQGEAHAKATAKNTAKAVVVLEKIEESIRDQDFGGGKFR